MAMDNHIDTLTVIASGFYREPSCDLAVQALVHAFNSKVFDENPDLLISFLVTIQLREIDLG